MANRILRDWTCSETINEISESAEIFFTRLIMKADDFGRFYGSPKLLKAQLFPLKDYSFKSIEKWRDECVKIGIIFIYESDGKEYLEIRDFNQRLRLMKSKFPEPLTVDCQMTVNCQTIDGLKRNRNETENEVETEEETKDLQAGVSDSKKIILFDSWWQAFDKKVGKEKTQKRWLSLSIEEMNHCLNVVADYVKSKPDKQFRKDPMTYLNGKHWNDEIIIKTTQNGTINNETGRTRTLEDQADDMVRLVNERYSKPDEFNSGDREHTEDINYENIE